MKMRVFLMVATGLLPVVVFAQGTEQSYRFPPSTADVAANPAGAPPAVSYGAYPQRQMPAMPYGTYPQRQMPVMPYGAYPQRQMPAYYYPGYPARGFVPGQRMFYPGNGMNQPGVMPGYGANQPRMMPGYGMGNRLVPMQNQPNQQPNQPNQQQVAKPSFRYASPYNPNIPATPGPKPPPPPEPKKVVKPWGDTRYIWPDFYTTFTGDAWDKMMNAPYDMGYMPGGWRFPSLSSPDPVTIGDAIANQVPPILDESANFVNFSN